MDAATMKHMALNFVKLDKFEGVDFRRWQKKMHFLLFSMSVVYVLITSIFKDDGDDATVEQIRKRAKILNLPKNYEIHWRLNIWLRMHQLRSSLLTKHNMNMDEAIQDSDKPKGNNVAGLLVVNMVKHNNSSRYSDNKGKHKHHDNTRADLNKKSKLTCWKCGKHGHLKKDCKGVMLATKGLVDGSSSSLKGQNMYNTFFRFIMLHMYLKLTLCRMMMLRGGMTQEQQFMSLNDGSILHIGNVSTALVHGRDCVDLKFSSGKIVSLFNVLHVPNMRKNLVSSSVLNNCGYKQVIESKNMTKRKPNLNYLRVWGCRAIVRLSDPKLKTLGKRGDECIFVGYVEHSKAFSMSVVYVLTTTIPEDDGDDATMEHIKKGPSGTMMTMSAEVLSSVDDDVAWRVDSGAIVHVCKDRCWFKTYDSLNNGSILHIGNESTTLVHGRGCVDLKLSSGKIVFLFNVLHVHNIRNNLGYLLLASEPKVDCDCVCRLRFVLDLRFVLEDLAFCLQKILRFVFRRSCVLSSEDLAFCLQKILRFVFRRSCILSSEDLAFCLRRSCVLSSEDLTFCL
nr:zinc finger, CCHC-type [Tanacetum cinerariifolium]